MKTAIKSVLLIFGACIAIHAQSIDKYSIDSGGDNVAIDNIQVLYTIGEVIVQEYNMGDFQISSGFINSEDSGTLGLTTIPNVPYAVTVYPNPTSEFINIKSDIPIDAIELYTILGSKVIETNALKINVSHLQSGIYIIKISIENRSMTKKIVIK